MALLQRLDQVEQEVRDNGGCAAAEIDLVEHVATVGDELALVAEMAHVTARRPLLELHAMKRAEGTKYFAVGNVQIQQIGTSRVGLGQRRMLGSVRELEHLLVEIANHPADDGIEIHV